MAFSCTLSLFCHRSAAQNTNAAAYTWTTFAGFPGSGSADGVGGNAQFALPTDIAMDTNGNIYVADTYNGTIRKITPAGLVSTIAGFPGIVDFVDGTNAAARFFQPQGICVDRWGVLYVTDLAAVRRISLVGTNWVVATLAGSITYGSADGTNNMAGFNKPFGITADAATNLYVADAGNHTIRKVTQIGTNWVVTTLAGLAGHSGTNDGSGGIAQFNRPSGVALDAAGNLYVADDGNYTIRKIAPVGTNWVVTTLAGTATKAGNVDGTNSSAKFNGAIGVTIDTTANLFVADGVSAVRKIAHVGTNWVVSTTAGYPFSGGYADGTGTNALFNDPLGLAVDCAGNLFISDRNNSAIRQVTLAGVVTTLAGAATSQGSANGAGVNAKFYGPRGVTADVTGNIYVADTRNSTVRKITPLGEVVTVAGLPGSDGTNDGPGNYARFSRPSGVTIDQTGNLYVVDSFNYTIRKITPPGVVSTIASRAQTSGTNDGIGGTARFNFPQGIVVDSATNLYVADTGNHTIRKITPMGTNWVVSTIAGTPQSPGTNDGIGSAALFNSPISVAVDVAGNVYVADSANDTIRRITLVNTNWTVVTIAGFPGNYGSADGTNSDASFESPYGITVDSAGNLYVADDLNNEIRKITPIGPNWVVTTIGGLSNGRLGSTDGAGSDAQFNAPLGITVNSAGNIFVADTYNNAIRKGVFSAYTATNPVPYTPPPVNGQLSVTLLPSEANGQWRFPWEYGWRTNGQTASNLVVGNYDIQFRAMPGWVAVPSTISLQVTNGGLTLITTNVYYPTYVPSGTLGGAGSLTVYLGATPPSGAGWRFLGDNTPYFPSGYTTNLLSGTYLIEFAGPFSGRATPPKASVQVSAGQATVVSVTYPLSVQTPGGVLLPQAVPTQNISDLTDYPFGFNGQLESDVGYGSGVAVQQNVVLTAAHLVFDDQNLSYVSQAYWFFQNQAQTFLPKPQGARAFYALSGYAAQRTNDLAAGLGVNQSSAASRNLDVAALYFMDAVAGGGYGGYLPSDEVPNSWLTSTSLKMLVGYPVDGSLFGDATIVPGEMYQTDPQPYPLSLAPDSVSGQQEVYIAPWFLSYPGNSGGPLYVQFNGYYYPAGVYLGTLYNGATYSTAVRAIDSSVVNLIAVAQADAGTGTNNTGGGVITIIPSQVNASNPGYVQFQLAPPAAVRAGAAWRLVCTDCDTNYSTATSYTLAVASTNAISVQFRSIPGWNLPTNQTVAVQAGQIATPTALYTDMPAFLSYKVDEGLRLFGASALTYRIDYKTNLDPQLPWLPLATNTLTTNTALINGTLPQPGGKFFRAVKTQ